MGRRRGSWGEPPANLAPAATLRRSAIACLAALAVYAMDLTDAIAQEPQRGQTVFQRARPDYDPLGIPLGSFRLFPSLVTGITYDDNVFADSDEEDPVSDAFGFIEPAVTVTQAFEGLTFAANGSALIERYIDTTTEDTEQYGFGAEVGYEITRSQAIEGFVTYDRLKVARGDPEDPGDIEPDLQDLTRMGASYTYAFPRFFVRPNIEYEIRDAIANENVNQDRNRLTVGGRVGYSGVPRVVPFVQVRQRWTDFRREVNGVSRDFDSLEGLVGAQLDLGGIVFGEIGIGVDHTTFDDPDRDDLTELAFRGAIEWNVTDLTSLRFGAERETEATTVEDADVRVRTTLDLAVEHELMRNVLIGGDVEFRQDDFEGGETDRSDDRVTAGANVEYLLNRNFSVFARYQYTNRTSNEEERDFSRNEVLVGLRSQL